MAASSVTPGPPPAPGTWTQQQRQLFNVDDAEPTTKADIIPKKERATVARQGRINCLKSSSASIHCVSRPSLLDSRSHFDTDFRGWYNLAGIVLVVVNARLVVENLMKYGILLKFPDKDFKLWPKTWPALTMAIALPLFFVVAHCIERIAVAGNISSRVALGCHWFNITAMLTVPWFVIRVSVSNFLSGLALMLFSVTGAMKLVSYAHVMHCDRDRLPLFDSDYKKTDEPTPDQQLESELNLPGVEVLTSSGVSLRHLFYFLAAPTLCYQHSYPRFPPRRRRRYILRRVVELVFCVVLMGVMIAQWINPLINNAMGYISSKETFTENFTDCVALLERVLKLSIPNLAVWLLIFYSLFHSLLNLLGELTRFGDRLFYKAWWNARTLKDYWNRWNIPVHNWVLRHIYAPCIRAGLSNVQAQSVVFLVSALLHELIVSVPFHHFKYWAFGAMMGQVPLIIITQQMNTLFPKDSQWGNILFWVVFCVLGQPVIVLLYYHAAVES